MGSNMQRQALMLEKQELPLIETGIEKYIAHESQSSLISKESGKIIYYSNKKIILKYPEYQKSTNFQKLINENNIKKIIKTCAWRKKSYFIEKTRKSNQNTYIKQSISINNRKWIKKGQILANGLGTLKNKLAIGKNILVGYIGWEGYNFEDAIVINEKLINEDIFTSIHTKKYKTFLINNNKEEVRTKIINKNTKINN